MKLFNTTDFGEYSSADYKKNVADHFNADPCGTGYSEIGIDKYTREYFDEIEKSRYDVQPWSLDDIRHFDISGKKVLEVGYGMGTDHLSMARMGGEMYGVSITSNDKLIIDKRFELYGYQTNALVADAEDLPFEDGFFDFVYSFGVVHHTPDTEKAISEIFRVLKPGGKCYISVYNKNSVYFWWTILFRSYILKGEFRKLTLKQRLSMNEYPFDDTSLIVRLYTPKEFVQIMNRAGFKVEKTRIDHPRGNDKGIGRFLPDAIFDFFAHKWGWYLIVYAEKE